MNEVEEELDAPGRSRRRWMVTSAAVVAGTVTACGTSSGNGSADAACPRDETPPASLPGPDDARCTAEIPLPSLPADQERFAIWNAELRDKAAGRESALVDLDAVDHNLRRVGQTLGARIDLRLVAKSLPCPQLLEYMMVTACTNRVMAFSEGMTRDLLCRFGSEIDILLGRPAAVEAAARTFAALDARSSGSANPAATVQWLVDTPERMQQYADLGAERGTELKISVEIDVGLRRGGARNDEELLDMLSVIDGSPFLRLAGFMGYEGHVGFAPEGANPDGELAAVQRRYADFVDAGQQAFPQMFEGSLTFNSGGSRTYHYYTDDLDSPVNEVAMGSAFFYPGNFSNIPDTELRRATYLASPVLKRIDPAEAPFAPGFLPGLAEGDPNLEVSYVLVAGGFPGDPLHPEGLVPNPVTTSVDDGGGGVSNLLSNQAEWLGARTVPLEVGDFVFYHPWEGDGVRWLSRLDVFRDGVLVDQWPTFQPGIRLT